MHVGQLKPLSTGPCIIDHFGISETSVFLLTWRDSICRALYQLQLVKASVARKFIPPELKIVEAFG